MVLKSDWPTSNVAHARPRLAVMSSIARYARVKAAECERYAATARDPETRQQYIQLARDWWEVARQGDRLRAKRSRSNIIIGEELREPIITLVRPKNPRHDCSCFLRS